MPKRVIRIIRAIGLRGAIEERDHSADVTRNSADGYELPPGCIMEL
jgi:hypothetical protein